MYFGKISFFPRLFDKRPVTMHGNLQLRTLLQMFTSNLSDSLNEYTVILATEIKFLLQAIFFYNEFRRKNFCRKRRSNSSIYKVNNEEFQNLYLSFHIIMTVESKRRKLVKILPCI